MSLYPKMPVARFSPGDRVTVCLGFFQGKIGTVQETRPGYPRANYTVRLDQDGDINVSELEVGHYKEMKYGEHGQPTTGSDEPTGSDPGGDALP